MLKRLMMVKLKKALLEELLFRFATFDLSMKTRVKAQALLNQIQLTQKPGYLRMNKLMFENLQGGASTAYMCRDFNGCMQEKMCTID